MWVKNDEGEAVNLDNYDLITNCVGQVDARRTQYSNGRAFVVTEKLKTFEGYDSEEKAAEYIDDLIKKLNAKKSKA